MKSAAACPLCGNDGEPFLNGVKDYFVAQGRSPDFEIRRCRSCGVGYSLPQMTAAQLSDFYPDDYEAYTPKKSIADFLQVLKYRLDLRLLKKFLKKNHPSLFEIGAGRGQFLNEARRGSFQVSGLEPSATAVAFAVKRYGIRLIRAWAEDFQFDTRYDAVIARHVIEHLTDPASCVAKIFGSGLAPDGMMMLKLPRWDSWEARLFGRYWHGYDIPRHRVHFSRRGIVRLLKQQGFKSIRVYSEVVPNDILRSLSYYALHGENFFFRVLAKIALSPPSVLRMSAAQAFGMLLQPWGAGRMIVLAGK